MDPFTTTSSLPVPKSAHEWRLEAKKHDVFSTSVHNYHDSTSGSKIERKQYLTFHSVWKTSKAKDVDFEKDLGINYRSAREELAKNSSWESYLSEVENGLNGEPLLGTFDMLYGFQRDLVKAQRPDEDIPKASSSYWLRTRSMRPLPRTESPYPSTPTPVPADFDVSNIVARLKAEPGSPEKPSAFPYTPKPASVNADLSQGMKRMHIEPRTPETTSSTNTMPESASPITNKESKDLPAVDDEQTVNAALILLPRSVCLRAPKVDRAKWTLERKAFNFGKPSGTKNYLFQARTDGHLVIPIGQTWRSLAIMEAKARPRQDALPYMQESAQMVAWVYAERDREVADEYRRVMICQDCQEIYLVVATYNAEYLRYIDGSLPGTPQSSLKMHEIGPFKLTFKGHMKHLGAILLALTRQLEEQATRDRPCRW